MKNKKYISELYDMYEEEMQKYIIDDDVSKLSRDVIDKSSEFEELLTEIQKQKLEDFLELKNERDTLIDKNIFIYAYSLATHLTTEALSNSFDVDNN